MYEDIGKSLGTDYFRIADQLTSEEFDYLRRVREFVDGEVLPVVNGYWERTGVPCGQPMKFSEASKATSRVTDGITIVVRITTGTWESPPIGSSGSRPSPRR